MKDNVIIKTLTAILLFIFISIPADADSLGSTEISYSTGKRSQTVDLEKRDLSEDYFFYK